VNISIKRVVRVIFAASMLIGFGARALAAEGLEGADVIVVSGTLSGQFLADALFHVGEFWMRVASNTEFHRWLSQGIDRKVVITLITDPTPLEDVKNVRILSGTLIHETAPNPTPLTTNVTGRLPEGNASVVHILFLRDEATGTIGAVTFETADLDTARKFEAYDGTRVNIVIKIG
jgi:hypothetical protein